VVGVLAAGTALGIGEAAAYFVRPTASPLIAVGDRMVSFSPQPVKDWAIRNLGGSDKTVLLIGTGVLLALCAAVIGVLAMRLLAVGLIGIAVFAGFGCYCAASAGNAHGSDVVPTLIGAAAAALVMVSLVRAASTAQLGTGSPSENSARPDRRRFLLGGAAAAGVAALAGFGGRAAQHARFDVAAARHKVKLPAPRSDQPVRKNPDLGKSGVPWQTPNSQFYRVDTALRVPQIDPDTWSLRIHGMVDRPLTLRYHEIMRRPLIERWITLCCVSNLVGGDLVGNARFLGARLADILAEAGVHHDADQLVFTSQDGMTIGCPAHVALDGRDSLLAVGMNGDPLPVVHGFPVRVVVPGLYGYVSACKWITDIEVTTFRDYQAYWTRAGYVRRPKIALESRIDRPSNNQHLPVGKPTVIAGVAWDQHVGVSAVQVQAGTGSSGEWQDARLAPVPSTDTWRQWVLSWTPPRPGTYTLRVRAVDAKGKVQTAKRRPPFPAGATGLHTITVRAG
jgi:DMSO/TMAO reductase YedYZ molybdopterin-dependent catalytic subunit